LPSKDNKLHQSTVSSHKINSKNRKQAKTQLQNPTKTIMSSTNKNDQKNNTIIEHIMKENASHQVVTWSKSYCPHCKATKELLQSLSPQYAQDVSTHDLDMIENGSTIQYYLKQITALQTVPVVFINNKYVGGNSDVQRAYKEGRLIPMLEETTGDHTSMEKENAMKQDHKECDVALKMNTWKNEVLFKDKGAFHSPFMEKLFGGRADLKNSFEKNGLFTMY
jgi:glutaredoxin 3